LLISGDFFGHELGKASVPAYHGQLSIMENNAASKVNSAKVENPRLR
jgi:hypothetical protein